MMSELMKYVSGVLFVVLLSGTSCTKEDPVPDKTTEPGEAAEAFIELPAEWKKAVSLMEGFPEGIEVYQNTTPYKGKALNAYCVVFDPQNPELEFKPLLAAGNTRLSQLYAEESGTTYACINGGFFGSNVSYSLVQHNKEVQAVNIKALTRPYNGTNTTYYPTRGAFGLTADYIPEVSWMYHVGSGNGTMYSYPAPSPNALNSAPEPKPSATFPAGGAAWEVNSAIGGSPVLISDNTIRISDKEELIAVDNTSSRARSAIGHTKDGKIILLAVEGNNPNGGAGLSLQELAELMKEMGCSGALNLDGGGSTSMMVKGEETVRPSASSGERAVMSVLFVKKK